MNHPILLVTGATGRVAETSDTVAGITGRPARRFANFAQEHAQVWK